MKYLSILFLFLTPLAAQGAPGDGSYLVSPTSYVSGSTGNGFDLTFTAGCDWPATGGLLTIYFPPGLGTPNKDNFFILAADRTYLFGSSPYTFNGQTVSAQLANVTNGDQLVFQYGLGATGFTVSSTNATENLVVSSYPESVTLGAGLALAGQQTLEIDTPTPSPTFSQTPTMTITPTPTISPTFTVSPTITQTFTETPVAAVESGKVFSYPNPFDLRKFDKVTFRFDPAIDARVTVFNLVGETVREVPTSDIQGSLGFAIWHGEDDANHHVAGGLYFVRVKGKKTYIKKFTVLN